MAPSTTRSTTANRPRRQIGEETSQRGLFSVIIRFFLSPRSVLPMKREKWLPPKRAQVFLSLFVRTITSFHSRLFISRSENCPLRCNSVNVPREHRAFLDVGDAEEASRLCSPSLRSLAPQANTAHPAWLFRAPPTPAPTRYIFPLPTLSIPPDCIKSMVSLHKVCPLRAHVCVYIMEYRAFL